jgi:hypothetical protein
MAPEQLTYQVVIKGDFVHLVPEIGVVQVARGLQAFTCPAVLLVIPPNARKGIKREDVDSGRMCSGSNRSIACCASSIYEFRL